MALPVSTNVLLLDADAESSNSKLVYLYLATVEEVTISELQSTLEMQQLALFPTLDTLEGKGLIERDSETFTATALRSLFGDLVNHVDTVP